MDKCRYCGKRHEISPHQRERLREFKMKYPWVTQSDLASLMGVGNARMSEIMRKDEIRGGL